MIENIVNNSVAIEESQNSITRWMWRPLDQDGREGFEEFWIHLIRQSSSKEWINLNECNDYNHY